MKKNVIVDGNEVECTSQDGVRYTCFIKNHNLYFSSRVGDDEMINKKVKIMIEAKEIFLKEFPEAKFA